MENDRITEKNNYIDSGRETRRNDGLWVPPTSERESESNRTPKHIQRPSHLNRKRG